MRNGEVAGGNGSHGEVAKVRLIMAKRASMDQDMRLRTAAIYYRIAEKCQEEGIEPEAYQPGQTDEEAARDHHILDDIFDTC